MVHGKDKLHGMRCAKRQTAKCTVFNRVPQTSYLVPFVNRKSMHKKYYKIADITVEVRSELPITKNTFHPKFRPFETDETQNDMVVIHHHFNGIPNIPVDASDRIYFRPPWAVYRAGEDFIYEWIEAKAPYRNYDKKVLTNRDHSHFDIHHDETGQSKFLYGGLTSLAMLPTDQILFGRMLAYRSGCIMHSLGIILNENGYLFVGHSSAGKSTMAQMLGKEAIVLCDDRNIIRKIDNELFIYGTWSHGDVPDISPLSAPLKGIFFLEQSDVNKLVRIEENSVSLKLLLACLIRPLATSEWWNLSMDLITDTVKTIPCWNLKFDKSGEVLDLIRDFSLKPS